MGNAPRALVAIVKRECETCQMVTPVLQQLHRRGGLVVYTQDDPAFPDGVPAVHDIDLEVSWREQIDTVPTLIWMNGDREIERTVGWSRVDWERLSGVDGLGADLPSARPGCGSMSVDPDRVDELRRRFEGGRLHSRHVELADEEDDIEVMFQ
ncbi:MAG: thioredoxin, partial [Nocardioidaceae bacterium]|nr:thioredoxin [Nocardioidaceae bacterium]